MTYSVSQGDIFGRLGTGIGKGLADNVPKEIERYRLSQGLKELGEQKDQSPFQQFSQLASIPGVTPQMLQSGSELLRQQGVTQALKDKAMQENQPKPSPFPERKQNELTGETSPSITTRKPIEETLKNYIPKTFEEIQIRAGELLKKNPALYAQDPQKALQAAQSEDQQNQAINAQYQQRRANEQNVQAKITKDLDAQRVALGASLPGNLYSEIEDKAINAVKSIEDGGEGLTEQEAMKKYGKQVDSASRDYNSLKAVGKLEMLARSPSENLRELRSIREKFKERDDLENFADKLVGENGFSYPAAYHETYQITDSPELDFALRKIPRVGKYSGKTLMVPASEKEVAQKSLTASEKLAPLLGKEGSPLAVAEELKLRNLDPQIWLKYVDRNRKKLDLTERQARELDKPRNFLPTLSDLWLFNLTGRD